MFTALALMPIDWIHDSEEFSEFSSYFKKNNISYFHHINKPMQFRPPFTPLLYIVKLGFSGVYIISSSGAFLLFWMEFCFK